MAVHRMVTDIEKLKELFGVSGEVMPLCGGQGTSFRLGNLVFKPVGNPVAYEKMMDIFSSVDSDGYKINIPVKSINGRYCELGYGAVIFEEGKTSDGRLQEKLRISELFHRDVMDIDTRTFPFEDHMWNRAVNVLFHGEIIPGDWAGARKELCESLLSKLDEVNESSQMIHSDLGGNILFRENEVPVVIDLSPSIAPKKFADAIIIADSIAWGGQPLDSVRLLKPFDDYAPFLKHAVAFRVLSVAFHSRFDSAKEKHMLGEWEHYWPVWEYAQKFISG